MLAEDKNEASDQELNHTTEHGEDGGTRLVGVSKGGEGKILCHGGENGTKDQAGQRADIEYDLVERGVTFTVGQRHIDVLEIGKSHIVTNPCEVLGQADDEDKGDVMPNAGLNKTIDDLQRRDH